MPFLAGGKIVGIYGWGLIEIKEGSIKNATSVKAVGPQKTSSHNFARSSIGPPNESVTQFKNCV
jgi:hypothetical protein